MFQFAVLMLWFQACLIQTALSQSCGCNSYGGTGTGQVGVSGNIDACGQTVVVGSVPVLGSVEFGGCAPACGSVSITGQCGCDCQSEQTLLPSASTYIPSGTGIGPVAAVQQSAPSTRIISQSSSIIQTSLSAPCGCQNASLSQSAPIRQSLSPPRASISQNTPSLTLSNTSNLLTANKPRASLSTPSISLNRSGSYGGTGIGQTGVSGEIDACGTTCVEGAVPVRGSVGFSGCSPTCGTVSINGQCGCECD